MTENGDPLENAIAERVNGIIKEEYLDNYHVSNISQANDLLTPDKVHYAKNRIETEKLWKNYYQKNTLFVK